MGFEGIKDIYYSVEEKWYGVLDAIDAHLPIYKIIDPIDTVIPSFILFLVIIFLLIVFGSFLILSAGQEYNTTFTIKTSDNKPVFDTLIKVQLMQDGKLVGELSGRTDSVGEVSFAGIKQGTELAFDINVSKGTYKGIIPVNDVVEQTIKLKAPAVVMQAVTKKIFVKTANGLNTTDNINLTFSCENSPLAPIPSSAIFNGTDPVEIVEPANCKLQASIANSKYKQKTYSVNSTMYDLFLEPLEQAVSSIKVMIRSNGYPVNDTSFKVKLTGKNIYESQTNSASEVSIQAAAGEYLLAVSDSKGNYGIATQTVIVDTSTQVTIAVLKAIKSRVSIKLVDETTGDLLENGIVTAKDSSGREIATQYTNFSGVTIFSFTDLGTYLFAGKRIGDYNGGYFPKEITQTLTGDINVTMQLAKVTENNAGRVKVKVKDQDGLPVINAKVMLKYKENDGLVEIYNTQNYVFTDLNGEATFIAGKVDGVVYAYSIKGPFSGSSEQKQVIIDQENLFNITVQVGSATIRANLIDEAGELVEGTAEILTLDGKTTDEHGLAGLISVEKGKFVRLIKAGQTVYIRFNASTYETYYSSPITLWPDKTYTLNITMLKQIQESAITLKGVFNENDAAVQTMGAGKTYYAKFQVNSQNDYDNVLLHFRVGKETMLENDIISIDKVESSGITSETRGTTYDPEKGYGFDSQHTTDGLAKWSNINFDNFGRGTREVKVWFKINKLATPNKELQFFFRGKFDNTKLPVSNASQDLYSDVYSSIVYYVGTESVCEVGFCYNSEWVYSKKDDLYINSPFEIKQVQGYTYHVTLLNNSDVDYGKSKKQVYLNVTVVGDEQDEKRVKILNYKIKDSVGQLTNNLPIYSATNLELNTFEKNATIDITMDIEGMKEGADVIKFELKSEGRVIYTKETSFAVVKEKDFTVGLSPQFVPALLNTQIDVQVLDEKGEYLPGVSVKVFAKEPGFEKYQVSSAETDRLGNATVNSGALFQGSKVILEITKEGYSRKEYSLTVSPDAVTFSPDALAVELNTYTKREEIKQIEFANLTQYDLLLKSITLDARFKDTINEDAMNGYFSELTAEERTIKAEDILDIKMLNIKLANSITQEGFIEPITISGNLKATFENPTLHISYDTLIPITIHVSSSANTGADCLVIKPTSPTTVNTQKAQARFDFEIINACASDNVNIPLDSLSVTSTSEIPGIAEVSVRSSAGGVSAGRTSIDGGKRVIMSNIRAGEKLFGTMTFAPSEMATGKSITIPLEFEAKFQGSTIETNPQAMNFVTNVINLKECMSVDTDSAPVGFKDKARITIDTTACLGQKIDIILCANDSGCSGGADGKITLSSKAFTLQNKSKDIYAYGPTYPGTYGITINARVRGTTGFSYIGEVPVSFLEQDGKFFYLNKYELMLVGAGSQDSILLTNKMLTQEVKVKANGCVWGEKDPGTDWMTVMGGSMMGAMIGNMVGAGFKTDPAKAAADKKAQESKTPEQQTKETYDKMSLEDKVKVQATRDNANEALGNIDKAIALKESEALPSGVTKTTYNVPDGSIDRYNTTYTDADGLKHTITVDTGRTATQPGTRDYRVMDVGSYGNTQTVNYNGASLANATVPGVGTVPASAVVDRLAVNTVDHQTGAWKVWDTVKNSYAGFTSSQTWQTNATNPVDVGSGFRQTTGTNAASAPIINGQTGVSTSAIGSTISSPNHPVGPTTTSGATTTPGAIPSSGTNGQLPNTLPSQDTWVSSNPANPTDYYNYQRAGNYTNLPPYSTAIADSSTPVTNSPISSVLNKLTKLSFAGVSEVTKQTKLLFPALNPTPVKKDTNRASFTVWAGHEQGWFTLIGAVVGGLLAYMSQDFDCSDSQYDQVVSFNDFVILLQGDVLSIADAAGGGTAERVIPSDAGDLTFTMSGITPEWDFTDADYSSVENVALKFTNSEINEPLPKYGTLTINSTVHRHGQLAGIESSSFSSSNSSYDVSCNNAGFGNYWIGSSSDAGACSGVSDGKYSQKYHIRVITGEPNSEDSFIKKATSCYMGALTGATGKEALPKVKLDWDWDSIKANTCDYTNPDYVYCDASQFMIALTKKLANLDEFMKFNGSQFVCPPDPIKQTVTDSIDQINAQTLGVPQGFIGIKDININLVGDKATAIVTIQNRSGASVKSYMSYSLKGQGKPDSQVYQWDVPASEFSTITFELDTPESTDIYYFTAVINGDKGDRTPVTRAFLNRTVDSNCWIAQTTAPVAGIPGLLYYVANMQHPSFEGKIKDEADLYNNINFAVYLTKDAFTQDFLSDFKEYYRETFLQKLNVNADEKAIVDYLTSGNFKVKKKFSGDNVIEAGLYDVWVKVDSTGVFRVIDGNKTNIEIQLLLIKKPSVDSPFYSMPFDGVLGVRGGRQGYGSVYKNNDEKDITISNTNTKVYTFNSAASNGVMNVGTNTKTSFDAVNSSVGTRGQVASASVYGTNAQLTLTPNYATPIIAKQTQEGTIGQFAFSIVNSTKAISTGGNIGYWTGAAKSKDFYGGNAIELFDNSPDYRLNNLGENVYGFKFEDTTRNGTMYTKAIFFVPEDTSKYQLVSKDDATTFWSTNSEFNPSAELMGIAGMKYNSQQNSSYIASLSDLFKAVEDGSICVSNDGASTSFWWNPAVIETTAGATTSLGAKELELVGSK